MITFWNKKKVLVTGGAGFIGSYVVEELVKAGAQVTVCISPKTSIKKVKKNLASVINAVTIKRVNLLSARSTNTAVKGHTIILHFAALDGGKQFKMQNEEAVFKNNVTMGLNILQAARKQDIDRLLVISSIEVYPQATNPITEEQATIDEKKILPKGYAGAKRFIEREAQEIYRKTGLPIAIARLGNTYGPRDHIHPEKRRVIPTFILQARNNENITLFGDGSSEVSFIHAADLAPNILTLVEKYAKGDPINLVSSQYISLRHLAEEIIKLMGSSSKITYIKNMKVPTNNRIFSTEKARIKIKYKEKIPLKKGLKEMVDSLKK